MTLQVRSSINQTTQIGPESTHGTAANADTRLSSISIELAPEITVRDFRPTGQLWRAVTALGKDATTASISGVAVYDELPYLWASLIKTVSPSQVGGGSITYDWVFQSSAAGGDEYTSYTVQQGDRHRAAQATHLTVTEAGFEINRDEITVSGAAIAKKFVDDVQMYANEVQNIVPSGTMSAGSFTLRNVHPTTGGTFTTGSIAYNAGTADVLSALVATGLGGSLDFYVSSAGSLPASTISVEYRRNLRQLNFASMVVGGGSLTGGSVTVSSVTNGTVPSTIALVPVLPNSIKVYADPTAGAIGTTKLTGVMMTGFRVSGRYGELWTLDADQESWTDVTETEPAAEFTLTAVADSEGMQWLARMRDNATSYFRIQALGGTIEGSLRRTLTIDLAGQVTAIGSLGDQDAAYAAQYTLLPVEDSSLGYAFKVTVRNTLSSL